MPLLLAPAELLAPRESGHPVKVGEQGSGLAHGHADLHRRQVRSLACGRGRGLAGGHGRDRVGGRSGAPCGRSTAGNGEAHSSARI